MVSVWGIVDDILSYSFYLFYFVLFYLSIKKCFWKEDKSKVKLFLLTLITYPFIIYLLSEIISGALVGIFVFVSTGNPSIDFDFTLQVASSVLNAIFYYFFILLSAWIVGKWLGMKKIITMVYLYVTFNTFFVFQLHGMTDYSHIDKQLVYGLDTVYSLFSLVLVLFFYRYAVRELAALPIEELEINWTSVIIPPSVFIVVYSILFMIIAFSNDGKLVVALGVFSIAIVILFIWAFYMIIKNLKATNVIKILSVEVMEALAHTIDAKDEYTNGHSVRVAKYSKMLAEKLGLSAKESESLYYMALLHDIGKIGVPNSIINSKTKLTEEQYAIIKKHPGLGYDILSEIKSRPDLSFGARWHHERYDGTGYPDQKTGEDIPLAARIIAVADSYDAMTSNRSYRGFLSQDAVRMEIEKNSGTQFDRNVARCMLEIIDEDKDYVLHE